jgi:hypothetical protein
MSGKDTGKHAVPHQSTLFLVIEKASPSNKRRDAHHNRLQPVHPYFSMSVRVAFIRRATEKKAIREAAKSKAEWIASEMTATEPVTIPTMNFSKTINVLLSTDRKATFEPFICITTLFNIVFNKQ